MRVLIGMLAAATMVLAGCIQVGPKDEPIHIILDVNIRVQVDEAVKDLWDKVDRLAQEKKEQPAPKGATENVR